MRAEVGPGLASRARPPLPRAGSDRPSRAVAGRARQQPPTALAGPLDRDHDCRAGESGPCALEDLRTPTGVGPAAGRHEGGERRTRAPQGRRCCNPRPQSGFDDE